MEDGVGLAELRRTPVPGKKDLREWRFRDKWSHDDTSTVLAWADENGCVLHEHLCGSKPSTPQTAVGGMAEARQLFAAERPMGRVRYFGFCGNCLTERDTNAGPVPSARDLRLLTTMQQVLNDVRLLGEAPIAKPELVRRMKQYGELLTTRELRPLLANYRRMRNDEDPDLSAFVAD